LRRTHILQRTAGKMFHQWAEVGNCIVGVFMFKASLDDSAYTSDFNQGVLGSGLNHGLPMLFQIFFEFFRSIHTKLSTILSRVND
jgi:3-deoxy-D-manno-octulosonic acid (KDO) 8-phosphate synthase